MTLRHTWSLVGGARGGKECYDGYNDGYGMSEVRSRVEDCLEQPQRTAADGGRWQPMGIPSSDGAQAWTPPPSWLTTTHPHNARPAFWPQTRQVQVQRLFQSPPIPVRWQTVKVLSFASWHQIHPRHHANFPKTSFVNKQLSWVLVL